MSKLDLFKELLPSIMIQNNVDVFESGEHNPESQYNHFMVNRALSLHYDTILLANAMNVAWYIPKLAQYRFLHGQVRRWKRPWRTWPGKKDTKEDGKALAAVQEYYGYSMARAQELLNILPDEEIERLIAETDKGGNVKG